MEKTYAMEPYGTPFVKICMAGKYLYPTEPYVSAKVRGVWFCVVCSLTHRIHVWYITYNLP